MKSVLLGYGTVGKGVEDLVRQVEGLEMTHVFVLPEFVDEPYFTNDGLSIVTDPETDIVFECLSGTEPSNTLIRAALKAGKHVITSNKATVAPNLADYIELARENGGSIQVEASVAGGIPFLDALLKLSKLEDLQGYEGIFNGTSNYILDAMQKDGADYHQALKQAQELGYAEYDPTNDVDGWDVFYKSIISNALAYGSYEPKIRNPFGISRLNTKDIEMAKKNGKIIRHISHSVASGDEFDTIIAPAFLSAGDYLANIPSNYNAQLIHAPSFEKLGYFGQGAGRYATAQAMSANAIDTLENREREIVINQKKKYNPEMIEENWVVRTAADLSGLKGLDHSEPAEDGETYYFFNQRNASLTDEVLAQDPAAMIALWRD